MVGGLWTIIPAWLRARYTINEIITSLMMSFVGINLANMLIKGPFRSTETTVPQTFVIPYEKLLPDIPGTRIHVGVLLAFVVVLIVHFAMTRTSFGMRLRVMGANPRAAVHSGISVFWFTMIGFFLSGALIATGAATEILGVWGYVRADWNPNWGLTLFALVFLARLNAMATIPIVFFFAVITMGGHYACREANLPDDFILMFVGFILLFMALTEYLGTGRLFRRMPGDLIAVRVSQRAEASGE
jgi:simple sugar transport system permease protein